jgi:hypothetical protein
LGTFVNYLPGVFRCAGMKKPAGRGTHDRRVRLAR